MSCKYNNSMYTITPPEDEVEFDYLEQILLSEDYETQEEIDHRLADEYKQFQSMEYWVSKGFIPHSQASLENIDENKVLEIIKED